MVTDTIESILAIVCIQIVFRCIANLNRIRSREMEIKWLKRMKRQTAAAGQ